MTDAKILPFPAIPDEVASAIDFQAVRRKRLGGSESSAILGLNPFQTAHDVWLTKMGLREREETEAMLMGKVLEPVIAAEYATREGVSFVPLGDRERFIQHAKHRWLGGHIDRLIQGRPVGMDAKSTDPYNRHLWGDPGTDEIPDYILIQVQHYMAIMDHIERWDVALLIGNRLLIYRVYPNRDIANIIVEQCGEWWERYVIGQTPPPVDYSISARKMLERLYPYSRGEIKQADLVHEQLVDEYRVAQERQAKEEEQVYYLRNLICQAIGEGEGLKGPFGQITWRRSKDQEHVDWEAVARALLAEIGLLYPSQHLTDQQHKEHAQTIFEEIISRYTTTRPGQRRFVPRFTDVVKVK